MVNKCKTCAVWVNGTCRLTNQQKEADNYCSDHIKELFTCEACGANMISSMVNIVGEHILCAKCREAWSGCVGCKYSACEFEQNPDPIPKIIPHTVQQGNMTMQTQIKNPERVKKYCFNCYCWNEDAFECNKQYQFGCGKREEK